MKRIALAVLGATSFFTVAHADVSGTVAHWSYDTPTVTVLNGNISGIADSTGNHNASPGSNLGSATAANGGPTFNSNPIPSANSVAGKFGQSLTLTGFNNFAGGGGQFLMFPELTEIMQANAAPSYTISMWINTLNSSFQGFAGLSDWGNSATTPGRYSYGFGPNSPTQIRAQTRFNNGSATGADIFARTPTTASLNDGNWHMLSWTFDTSAGIIKSYFDGSPVESFTSVATSFQMVTSSSSFGTLGLKGDSGNFINGSITFDEMYVFRGVATDTEIQGLFSNNAIPEPNSVALVGMGALFLSARRRSA